jgi:Fic family protein
MKIKEPPELLASPFSMVFKEHGDKIDEYMSHARATLPDGRWLHFDQLCRRWPKDMNASLMWSLVKMMRSSELSPLLQIGEPSKMCSFKLTSSTQRAISLTDQKTTHAQLTSMLEKIGENAHIEFLVNGLTEDEAISSSQLEGAVTTTKVAKELLRSKAKGKTIGEKMIVGNMKMMDFIWEKRKEELSLKFIADLHEVGTEGIDDDNYKPAIFRFTDDVVVEDNERNIIYQPPPCHGLESRLKKIIDWVNEKHHEHMDNTYIHPLIKAITLHFCIGFEHPFYDGNGRVARALFYWCMFKHGFSGFRYMPISYLLKQAPAKYAKSYLYTETDDFDLTYFIDYQCGIITRAIYEFELVYAKTRIKVLEFDKFLVESGLYKKLSEKEKILVQVAKSGVATTFTAQDVAKNLSCSQNTALTALKNLTDLKIFMMSKLGRNYIFKMNDTQSIIDGWVA